MIEGLMGTAAQILAASRAGKSYPKYTDNEFDAPLSFADMKTLNSTLRLYNIDRDEFMEVLNRYIQIKEESDGV